MDNQLPIGYLYIHVHKLAPLLPTVSLNRESNEMKKEQQELHCKSQVFCFKKVSVKQC